MSVCAGVHCSQPGLALPGSLQLPGLCVSPGVPGGGLSTSFNHFSQESGDPWGSTCFLQALHSSGESRRMVPPSTEPATYDSPLCVGPSFPSRAGPM